MKNLGEALERVTRVAGIRGAMLVAESDGLVVGSKRPGLTEHSWLLQVSA